MKIGVFSTNEGLPWGGSEHLWGRAALRLLEKGRDVAVSYKGWPEPARRLREIEARGGNVTHRRPAGARRRGGRLVRAVLRRLGVEGVHPFGPRLNPHARWLRRERPDFVLISVSYHKDDVSVAAACRRRGVPYALLLHCASWRDWLGERRLPIFRRAYGGAERCFFVSRENRDILEANLAAPLNDTQVVCNPLSVRPEAPPAWPSAEDGWRMACVGRMHLRSKGQDLILNVLSRDKWRARPLTVTFWGQDQNSRRAFDALVRRYELGETVRHAGFSERPLAIWEASHALLLPSRYEGMPMVTPEAMFCARVPVVTACGRNPDFVDDSQTGFLAEAPTPDLLDEAMERAWHRRRDWQAMGREARRRIEQRYDAAPVRALTEALEKLASPSP